MQWMRASRPEAAVTCGGQVQVRTGSTSATSGIRLGLTTPCFTLSFSLAKMAIAVTSEPVPAVVGTAMSGQALVRHLVDADEVLELASVYGEHGDVILATSMAEPPPKPTIRS